MQLKGVLDWRGCRFVQPLPRRGTMFLRAISGNVDVRAQTDSQSVAVHVLAFKVELFF